MVELSLSKDVKMSFLDDVEEVRCPMCRNAVFFTDLFTKPLNSEDVLMISRPLLSVIDIIKKEEKELKIKCPFCPFSSGCGFETLMHAHTCKYRALPCFACSKEKTVQISVRNGRMYVDFKHWFKHLNSSCQGTMKCPLCRKKVLGKNIPLHLEMHAIIQSNPDSLHSQLEKILSGHSAIFGSSSSSSQGDVDVAVDIGDDADVDAADVGDVGNGGDDVDEGSGEAGDGDGGDGGLIDMTAEV